MNPRLKTAVLDYSCPENYIDSMFSVVTMSMTTFILKIKTYLEVYKRYIYVHI